MYPLVLDLAADKIPVTVTCQVLGFSKQAFYKWRAKPVSDRDYDDAHLINAAIDVHHDDPEFGYRFITDELSGKGWKASRNRVNRLCTMQKLWSVHARKRGTQRRPGPPVHDDLVGREFTAQAPNLLWFTDITEHPTGEGKLYLCAVKDACSKRIVGYSIDARNDLTARRGRAAQRHHPPRPGLNGDRALRQRQPVPITHLPAGSPRSAAPRVHGPRRKTRGQRRHGVVLQPAAEERAQPVDDGPLGPSSARRWCPGSRPPTTADDAKTPSEGSPPSSSRHSYSQPLTRPDHLPDKGSIGPWADPSDHRTDQPLLQY
ncbi:hypothetical protein GCM10009836_20480 [Pseudonocardia ailaonensis]|uniref:HTH-like domain-containing protein n=1 Tax=Pseudonocardia ailaonensis TaxID=367279 RepID=A0ABN2MWZ0_9PSEU